MSILSKDLSVETAARLGAAVRLVGVHVGGIRARTYEGADMRAGGKGLGFNLQPIEIVWAASDEDDLLRVLVPLTLHVTREGQPIAELGVLLRLDYRTPPEVRKESPAALSSFAGISGCMHAWPYLRSEVQQLSTKLELPPLVLPLIVSGQIPQVVSKVRAFVDGPTTKKRPRARLAQPKKKAKRTVRRTDAN